MSAFNKVLEIMKNRPIDGHALANIANIKSLKIANKEIEEILKCVKQSS